MEALPALSDAWALILQPVVLGYLVLGVVMGLCIGVFPGLGGIAGLSLLLPFMFGMDPILGLALMVGMVAVVPTSDTFASVLMGKDKPIYTDFLDTGDFVIVVNAENHNALLCIHIVGNVFLIIYVCKSCHNIGNKCI